MAIPARAFTYAPTYCPLCGLERRDWPKTHIELLTIHQTPDGPVAHTGMVDLSDDRWSPTPAGMVWYANWKREHPQAAEEVERWAREAVDRAIAAKRAREAAPESL
jgi:hypothetical protein